MDGGGGGDGFKDLLFHPFHQVTISAGFGLVVWVFLITLSGLGDPQIASAMLISVDDPIQLATFFSRWGKNPPTRSPVGNVLGADFSSNPTNQPTNQPYHHHLKVVGLGLKIHTWPLPPCNPSSTLDSPRLPGNHGI